MGKMLLPKMDVRGPLAHLQCCQVTVGAEILRNVQHHNTITSWFWYSVQDFFKLCMEILVGQVLQFVPFANKKITNAATEQNYSSRYSWILKCFFIFMCFINGTSIFLFIFLDSKWSKCLLNWCWIMLLGNSVAPLFDDMAYSSQYILITMETHHLRQHTIILWVSLQNVLMFGTAHYIFLIF